MASQKEYAYAIKGNKLSLFEKDYSGVQNGQTISAPNVELPRGSGNWKSPQSDVTEGIEIEFTSSSVGNLVDESSEIPLPEYLAKVLIYYIKAKLMEVEKDFQAREYYMKQFYKGLEKHNKAKIHGARRMSRGSHRII